MLTIVGATLVFLLCIWITYSTTRLVAFIPRWTTIDSSSSLLKLCNLLWFPSAPENLLACIARLDLVHYYLFFVALFCSCLIQVPGPNIGFIGSCQFCAVCPAALPHTLGKILASKGRNFQAVSSRPNIFLWAALRLPSTFKLSQPTPTKPLAVHFY